MSHRSPNFPPAPTARPRRLLARAAVLLMLPALLLAGFGCKNASPAVIEASKPITLKYWRVFDDQDAFQPMIDAYRQLHPNINIEYSKFRFEEYEAALLDAMAEDQGPDIFSLQNTWMLKWQPRLATAPGVVTVPFREMQGTIKKEAVTVLRQVPGMTLKQLANDYLDVVYADAVIPTEQEDPRAPLVPYIYGLPLAVDTMVLYYNRDILNAAGISQPATQWREFQDHVKRITRLDETGAILQSAAALGTADNVERSQDILALLMMQNGAPMTNESGMVTFDRFTPETAGQELTPGAAALVFNNDFANPEKEVYTWNDKMPASLDAFAAGRTAYFFGYSYHLAQIRALNPKLNFSMTGFPQIEGNKPVYYANYWLEVVSKKTAHLDEAWDFVRFITAAEQVQKYLNATGKPTALRSLVNSQLENTDLSVFAAQLPSVRSWYRGLDAIAAEKIFNDMIRQMIAGDAESNKIVELGAAKVNQTIK
ncbi:MAG: extracellular solute-binding protein [Patescibacteria group bacterium]|jgi:ABC-type glycerol-3-phosphate transport system substrate-binding protein